MRDLISIATFLFGVIIPLIGSGMIPNGSQRWGGAIFSLIGIGVIIGMASNGSTPMSMGLATGFVLASVKLATGLRFL